MNEKRQYFGQGCCSSLTLALLALLLAVPTVARASVAGRLTRERTAQVGEKYQGTILLSNRTGTEPKEVKLYQTDYLFFCDGTTQYGEPGKVKRSNADWITFSPSHLTIPPESTALVNYTVEVPDEESLTGTYWSMLMVEGIPKESPESVVVPEGGRTGVGILQIVRQGIQFVTHIGDTGSPKPRFIGTKLLAKKEGGRVLHVDLGNEGDRWMKPMLWVELFNEDGRSIGKFEGGIMRIYPGTSIRHRIDLSDVPEGEYKALVVGDAGGDNIFGARYTLKIPKRESAEGAGSIPVAEKLRALSKSLRTIALTKPQYTLAAEILATCSRFIGPYVRACLAGCGIPGSDESPGPIK